jgi:hypothetical protein
MSTKIYRDDDGDIITAEGPGVGHLWYHITTMTPWKDCQKCKEHGMLERDVIQFAHEQYPLGDYYLEKVTAEFLKKRISESEK